MKLLLVFGIISCLLALSLAAPFDDLEDHEQKGDYYEGDIEDDMAQRNGLVSESRRWPNNEVYYKIDEVFDEEHKIYILEAMARIAEISCIRFHPAPEGMTKYLHFIGEPTGCHTKVGYQNKLHTLNLEIDPLNKGCFKLGTIMHEILHSLGFRHQQCAADRDEYVLIAMENIKDGKEGNFKKYDDGSLTDFGVEYDYGSILHYSSTAFSKNGKKTIIPLQDENIEIGQRRDMSASDISKLNMMYKCPILV